MDYKKVKIPISEVEEMLDYYGDNNPFSLVPTIELMCITTNQMHLELRQGQKYWLRNNDTIYVDKANYHDLVERKIVDSMLIVTGVYVGDRIYNWPVLERE